MLKQQFSKLKGWYQRYYKRTVVCVNQQKINYKSSIVTGLSDPLFTAMIQKCVVHDFAYSTVDKKTSGIISNLFLSDNIIIKHSQKQSNGKDCGLFVIANAISNGVDPCKIKLIEHLLRTHLMKCFDEGIMTLLPCTF